MNMITGNSQRSELRSGSRLRTWLCTAVGFQLLGAVSCGGSSDPATNVEGIYSVTTHTENAVSCGAEGGPAKMTAPYLIIRKDSFVGFTYYSAIGCASVAACRTLAAEKQPNGAFSFIFDTVNSADKLSGATRSTGFSDGNGNCKDPYIAERTLVRTAEAIRIEDRTFKGDSYKSDDPKGFCTTELGAKASKGKPCSALEVLTGTFVEALPKS